MTISLATKESELDDASAESVAEAVMGVDLSLLGAVTTEAFAAALGSEMPVEYASYPRIASCAQAATRGGIDFVCLDATFRTRSDNANQLDAARVAACSVSTRGKSTSRSQRKSRCRERGSGCSPSTANTSRRRSK